MMASQAVERIHHKFTSDLGLLAEFATEALGGTKLLLEGIGQFDMDKLQHGTEEMAKLALIRYDKSPKDWYDDIHLMFELADCHFE